MASRTLPGIGLKADWDLGEDDWKDEMDTNLRVLSAVAGQRVLEIVAAEPGAPAEGDIVILDETHATQANNIAVYDEAGWHYIAPIVGMEMFNVDTGTRHRYNGTEWASRAGADVYRVGFFWTSAPSASEVLLIHTFTDACTFADDFAGSLADVGVNPAAAFDLDVRLNGASIGTISISNGGVVTFTTAAGAVDIVAGDQLRVVAPAGVDTAANVSISMKAFF